MTVEAFYIIRIFQPLLDHKVIDAKLVSGRWAVKYGKYGFYYDLSSELKGL